MAMLPDDPNASIMEIIRRRKSLSPFMQGLTGNTNAPPNPGWDPSISGVVNTLKSMVPEVMIPPGVVSPQDNYPDPRVEAYRSQSQRGVPLDPAAAGAQGFRIPDYIPAAQTAGGSGDYMSKVGMIDSSVSPAQTQGGSGDYMSNVSQDVGSGAATPKDDGLFSFFGKPQATDAMTAFGAAMLKGKNFAEGLANASTAVNDVSKQYRPYTTEELQRMTQKAEIERMARAKATGQQVEWSRPLYDSKGQLFYPATDANGSPGFYNSNTGRIEPTVSGGLRAEDSTKKYESKSSVKSADDARNAAMDSFKRSSQANELLNLYDSAGGGAGFFNKYRREASTFFNTDLLGVQPGDTQRIENILSDLELSQAQTQRGLGQLTEAERAIIRRSLPGIEMEKGAFESVVTALKRQSERAKTIYQKWSRDKELQAKYPNIEDYYLDWMTSQEGQDFDKQTQSMANSIYAPKGSSSNAPASGIASGIKWSIE